MCGELMSFLTLASIKLFNNTTSKVALVVGKLKDSKIEVFNMSSTYYYYLYQTMSSFLPFIFSPSFILQFVIKGTYASVYIFFIFQNNLRLQHSFTESPAELYFRNLELIQHVEPISGSCNVIKNLPKKWKKILKRSFSFILLNGDEQQVMCSKILLLNLKKKQTLNRQINILLRKTNIIS